MTRYTFCGTRYLSHCRTIPAATLTFWGHVTSSVTWPLDSQYAVSYRWSFTTIRLSCTVTILGSWSWPFGVTWRHRSRDHSSTHLGFPIGGQWRPCICWARLLRYLASNILGSRPWPSDSQHMVSYKWSIGSTPLSRRVAEILRVKH